MFSVGKICVLVCAVALLPKFACAQEEQKKEKKEPQPFRWVNPLEKLPVDGLMHCTFKSPSMGIDVGYVIYLPPTYESDKEARFPVVYYLHGGRPGSELKSISLTKFVDAAIKSKDIEPTIYVFVNGGPVSHYNYPEEPNGMGEDVFIKELIPHIDRSYRTIADRKGRGLEGFSQGGRGTMRISLKHPHLFCSVAAGGGGYATEKRISEENGRENENVIFAKGYNTWDLARDYVAKKGEPFELMIFVGDEGINYQNNLQYTEFLTSLGIPYQKLVVAEAPHSAKAIYEKCGADIMRFHARNFH